MKKCLNCDFVYESVAWGCPSCGVVPPIVGGVVRLAPELDESCEGFDSSVFEFLAEREAGSFWFASRNKMIEWGLRKFFPETESLLEAGCGTGFVLSHIERSFPGIRVCGAEAFSRGLEFAAKRLSPRAELIQMDATRVPFYEEFDVVCAFDVLEHIENDTGALAGMFEAAKPGGGILVTVPQHQWLWSKYDEMSFHRRRYGARELKEKIEAAGFAIERMTSFMTLLFPAMLASRMVWMISSGREISTELRPGLMNAAMEKIMGAERAALKAGARLPFGGSLLVAARKPPRA
ncbi:MAG TPA: class I SAM-dependent methyltransferase [bacterium]|nr:class I SAM-dependent methyltransferase [bacterium]